MLSFYPGPSRVYDKVPRYVQEAFSKGILSLNHRSPEFEELYRQTVVLLRTKVGVPRDYSVLFTSSATECWEVLAQSLVRQQSIHIYNGAFGAKWYEYTRRLRPEAESVTFGINEPAPEKMVFTSGELICLTQNETSNGTQVSQDAIRAIKTNNPNHLVAVDATSSMAGIKLDFPAADIWFASVQKCFGLPAGLALIVLSPRANQVISQINESAHYNSLTFMNEMMAKWQTSYTPNVLGIYLLMRTLKDRRPIATVGNETRKRAKAWYAFLKKSKSLRSLVTIPELASHTVITVQGDPESIQKMKADARKKGILLGEGYGALKKETFRIANFPAIKQPEIAVLMRFLSAY